jgi:hypothetical protein
MIKHPRIISCVCFTLAVSSLYSEAKPPSETPNGLNSSAYGQCQLPDDPLYNNPNLRIDNIKDNSLPEASDAIISRIRLVRHNIFDTDNPKEDNFLFRGLNSLNIITKEHVILQQLLFQEGDNYNAQMLRESERILRQANYLYDAKIQAEPDCNGNIVVTITTQELWTLTPEISYSRSGGESKTRLGFRDTNLFGLGKRVSLVWKSDVNRTGYTFVYEDPNIWGSRYRSRVEFSDNDDGERFYVDFNLPFYSLSANQSYGAYALDDQRESSLYYRGDIVSKFSQHNRMSQIYYGWGDKQGDLTKRWLVGWQQDETEFEAIAETNLPLAENRQLSYPWLAYQLIEDRHITLSNFDSIGRTEDLNLGWDLFAKLGYSDQSITNDDSRVVLEASGRKAYHFNDTMLWRMSANLNGYWNTEQQKSENLVAYLNTNFLYNSHRDSAWFANLSLNYGDNLTDDKQLTLGGDTGLRGYPLKYQVGDRSLLLNLEKRYYWEYHLLQLFKVGGAVFFDVGRAWFPDQNNGSNGQFLKDAGIGLRLAPSRATANTVIHIDLAFPFDTDNEIDNAQWIIKVKNRF